MTRENLDKVLKTNELAKFLAVSNETVARWCQSGKLPAFKIGGQWRVRMSDLQRLIRMKVESRPAKVNSGKPLF